MQRSAGDVFDALHQLDEEVLRARSHGCEADTAVAHDDGRHAVPTRRGDLGVPRDLAVVVGVDVDPPRGGNETVAVDLAVALVGRSSHRGEVRAVDGDVTG